MQVENIVSNFIKTDIGSVIITDEQKNVIYSEGNTTLPDNVMKRFISRIPPAGADQKKKTWELTDSADGHYYRIVTSTIEEDGKLLQCHCLTDVTDFVSLSKDISEYSSKLSDVADFQANILMVISGEYDSFLPALVSFCRSDEAIVWMERRDRGKIYMTSYNGEWKRESFDSGTSNGDIFTMTRFERRDGYRCMLSESSEDCRYVVALKDSGDMIEEYFKDISVYNVIRLFIENGILRDKIIYSGEHDRLTELYNHEKFMSLLDDCFGRPSSLAMYMLTVNDLEYMNDHYGHVAGDALIKKAAKSIMPLLSENVLGFRFGGDKFAVVAMGISEEEAEELLAKWRHSLEEVNSVGRMKCFVSCGMSYGSGDYDPDKLMEQADIGMYREKRRLKEDIMMLSLDGR